MIFQMTSNKFWYSPQKSQRKLSLHSGLSPGSVHMDKNILKLHPYHAHVTHKLEQAVKEKLFQYYIWFTHFIWMSIGIFDKVFFHDAAWFHLSGHINSQKSRIQCWKSSYLPWKTVTFFKRRNMMCSLSLSQWSHFLQWNLTAEHYQEQFMDFIYPLEVDEQDC
jgi:hypothetical protein